MAHDDETTKYTHPSYGIVGFNRVQCSGGRRLFGSALTEHYHSIRVRIAHCERRTDHGLDRFSATDQILEFELSAAQFAEGITAMNVGDGVPCTINWIAGVGQVEEPPETMTASEHAKHDFKARMKTFAASLTKTREAVEKAVEGKVITGSIRESIRGWITKIVQEVGENIPYFVECYEEATVKISSAAKAEADAWLTAAIHRAGLQGLRAALSAGSTGAPDPLALPAASVVTSDTGEQ